MEPRKINAPDTRFNCPSRADMSDDFPDPTGPITQTHSPRRIEKSTPKTPGRWPLLLALFSPDRGPAVPRSIACWSGAGSQAASPAPALPCWLRRQHSQKRLGAGEGPASPPTGAAGQAYVALRASITASSAGRSERPLNRPRRRARLSAPSAVALAAELSIPQTSIGWSSDSTSESSRNACIRRTETSASLTFFVARGITLKTNLVVVKSDNVSNACSSDV